MNHLDHNKIVNWLREDNDRTLEELWQHADSIRNALVGDEVHLRGLIEFSNVCRRRCGYCGLNASNKEIQRYRMAPSEIVACAEAAVDYGYGTVVLQCGEDPALEANWLSDLIRRLKSATPLAITLSVGEHAPEILENWFKAGADRYLLRFETSDPKLYETIHPSLRGIKSDRIGQLRVLREIGYEVGSGVMIGIPGQTYESLARDIELFQELDLDMIGVGPFIPHAATNLGKTEAKAHPPRKDQVPNTEKMTYKVVALTRMACPTTNIPSTSALATLNQDSGRELGLNRGANVVMPNLTPPEYRKLYEIYPNKVCIDETAGACHSCMKNRIRSLGRTISAGPGTSINYLERHHQNTAIVR
ncbi:MAG: [FeFe] hydrogenase H-cluster radical SAM maturase HydE [Lentisphaeria bacterium]